jgi:hypothetical protein
VCFTYDFIIVNHSESYLKEMGREGGIVIIALTLKWLSIYTNQKARQRLESPSPSSPVFFPQIQRNISVVKRSFIYLFIE